MKKLRSNTQQPIRDYCESCGAHFKYTRGKPEGYCNCGRNKSKEEKACRHIHGILRKLPDTKGKVFVFTQNNNLKKSAENLSLILNEI